MNGGAEFLAAVQLLALGVAIVVLLTHLQGWIRRVDRRVNMWATLFAWMACLAVCAYLWESVAPPDVPLWSRKLGLLCAMGMGVVGLGVASAIVHRPLPRPWFAIVVSLWAVEAVLLFGTNLVIVSAKQWTMANGVTVVYLQNGPVAHLLQLVVVGSVIAGLWKVLPYTDPTERRYLVGVPVVVVVAVVNDELLAMHVLDVGVQLLSLAYVLCAISVYSLVQHRYRRALAELGDVVAARTAEVDRRNHELTATNLRLQDALDAATAGARAKEFFVENMSHELRMPLTGILGVVEVLDDERVTDSQREVLAQLRASGEDLLRTVNGILDENRIAAGALELVEIDFDVTDVVESAVEAYAGPAVQKDVTLFSMCHPSLPRVVRGDPMRLRQIVSQLVDNAVKFTAEGHVKVEAWPTMCADGRMELAIEVVDTGCGIEPARREAIFEAFTQGDSSSTKVHKGIGLGLTLARQLVELLGGEITLDSTPGLGSRFRATVPLAVIDERPWEHQPFDGMTMLVVATDAAVRECLRMAMAWLGAEVVDVATFGAALDALEQHDIASILLDSSTPVDVGDRISEVIRTRRHAGAVAPFVVAISPNGLPTAQTLPASWLRDSVVTRPGRSTTMRAMRAQFAQVRTEASEAAGGGPADVDLRDGLDDNLPVPVASFLGGRPTAASEVAAGLAAARSDVPPPRRVLIVEDHPVNQRVLSAIVARLGATPVVRGNGAEAVAAYKETGGAFDVILMDCQMPLLDGYAATEAIRAWEDETQMARIPIIAVTANVLAGDRERCLAAGMDDYLTKPVRPEELGAAIGRRMAALAGGSALPAGSAQRPALPAANRALPPARSTAPLPGRAGVLRAPDDASEVPPSAEPAP